MTKDYEDLQCLDTEENGEPIGRDSRLWQELRELRENMTTSNHGLGTELHTLSAADSKLWQELRELSKNTTSSNLGLGTELNTLSAAGHSLDGQVKSLESKLQEQTRIMEEERSRFQLHIQRFLADLRTVQCQITELKDNSSKGTCCPPNWTEHSGSCYWTSRVSKSWSDAKQFCQTENSHLVVINSQDEQKFIQHLTIPALMWIGLTDSDGKWKWVDDTDYNKTPKNWGPGQPDDYYGHGLGGGEDCAHLLSDGLWNDDHCSRSSFRLSSTSAAWRVNSRTEPPLPPRASTDPMPAPWGDPGEDPGGWEGLGWGRVESQARAAPFPRALLPLGPRSPLPALLCEAPSSHPCPAGAWASPLMGGRGRSLSVLEIPAPL
uniref:C-type lectin domain-containing protein n=1 Tax=Ornithorhynchus anatinus TaxID=9258 RepID=A0A6I8PP61_ORNAN